MRATPLLLERWKTGELTGEAKHAMTVRIRRGFMKKMYGDSVRLDTGSPIFPPLIYKGHNHHCWQGFWTLGEEEWITLPNVISAKYTRSFQDKGSSTLTVMMDNVAYVEHTGLAGAFHEIVRGYYSPQKGIKMTTRPHLWATNEWANVLNGGYQVELWEGYGQGDEVLPGGDAVSRTWTGIIETCDMESHPDKITLTARDFSIMLTDCRLMGWNKAAEIRSPVTFADRRHTVGQKKVYNSPRVSSGNWQIAENDGEGVVWTSEPQADRDHTEWVEIELPPGYYEDFFYVPQFPGMDVWVSLNIKDGGMDRSHPLPDGWVDLGLGDVPGGGPAYIKYNHAVSDSPARRWPLGGHSFRCGQGSRLRLSFRQLGGVGDGMWAAGVDQFAAFLFGTDPQHPEGDGPGVNAKHWVLVEDAADVVRMVLIWAGFKEWHVEDFGWTLAHPLQFGEDKFLMDLVDEMLNQGDFVFYMGDPSDDDMSLGVPHFEHQAVTQRVNKDMMTVRDTEMTETLEVKWDLSDLPYIMRYRGNISKKGQTLDRDLVKRVMATYYPPWDGADYVKQPFVNLAEHQVKGMDRLATVKVPLHRMAGIRRQFSETLGANTTLGLETVDECYFACILAAIQYAIGMCTGQFQIAGLPQFRLNEQVSLVDEGTGTNSRMWLASIESDHVMGENGGWTMVLGGSMLDTEDMMYLLEDYAWAFRRYQAHLAGR